MVRGVRSGCASSGGHSAVDVPAAASGTCGAGTPPAARGTRAWPRSRPGPPYGSRQPPSPSRETQKPKETAATRRRGPGPWPSRAMSAFAMAIRARPFASRPAFGCRTTLRRSTRRAAGAWRSAGRSPHLQRPVERRARGRVPHVEVEGLLAVRGDAAVRADALQGERRLERVQELRPGARLRPRVAAGQEPAERVQEATAERAEPGRPAGPRWTGKSGQYVQVVILAVMTSAAL